MRRRYATSGEVTRRPSSPRARSGSCCGTSSRTSRACRTSSEEHPRHEHPAPCGYRERSPGDSAKARYRLNARSVTPGYTWWSAESLPTRIPPGRRERKASGSGLAADRSRHTGHVVGRRGACRAVYAASASRYAVMDATMPATPRSRTALTRGFTRTPAQLPTRTSRWGRALRCRIIPACATGASDRDVAARWGSTPHAVDRRRKRFASAGAELVGDGRPSHRADLLGGACGGSVGLRRCPAGSARGCRGRSRRCRRPAPGTAAARRP